MNKKFMNMAYLEAKKSYDLDEIPVGCVVVRNGGIIATAHNCKEKCNNAIMHAELLAIDEACKVVGNWRLDECELYTTLEPCMMCMGAIVESRIKTVYFGTKSKSKQMFVVEKLLTEKINFVNVDDERCSKILSDFFKNRRKN